MDLTPEEQAVLAGSRGEAPRRALEYQIKVGRFWGAKRLVPVTNVHMMGDIEVMGDAGLEFLKNELKSGARCAVGTTTNARCIDFAHCDRLGQAPSEVAKERELPFRSPRAGTRIRARWSKPVTGCASIQRAD